jgi:hypothetical protein
MRKLLFTALVILSLTSCKKDDDDKPADTAATITTTSPPAGGLFNNGSVINIQGTVNDPDGLKNIKVEIKHKTAGTIYYSNSIATGTIANYNFNWSWTVAGMTATVQGVIVITATDQYDYTQTKEINLTLEN